MGRTPAWDAELYEARHSFVFKFGEDLIAVLNPKAGERILDLGCGTGQLTAKIADSDAQVIGLDSSPEMVGQARQNFPQLKFVLGDAARMEFTEEFDAVFSNAALHWIIDMPAAAECISTSLRPGGRFVAELGGKGNVHLIESAVQHVLAAGGHLIPPSRTVFPSISEYSGVLESRGLEVRLAILFDRPTRLEGDAGMENWLRQFMWYYFQHLTASQQNEALQRIVDELRPQLFRDGNWYADYRRLRVTAYKI